MHSYITTWDGQTPPGFAAGQYVSSGYTVLLVSSNLVPVTLSATYAVSYIYPHGVETMLITLQSSYGLDDAAALSQDNRLIARATKMPPVVLPPALSPGDDDSLVSAALLSLLPVQGLPGLGVPHDISGLASFTYVNVLNVQTGQTYQLFNGDTITVTFTDAANNQWTAQFQVNVGGLGSIALFPMVPGSLRDANGNDPTKTPTSNTGQTGASQNATALFTPPTVLLIPGDLADPPGTCIFQMAWPDGAGTGPVKLDNITD
jgi:hypothetical protein